MDYIIEVESVMKTVKNKTILDGVSFKVKRNIIFGIVGPNGSGKSSILKCLLGLYKFQEGSIKIDGNFIHDSKCLESVGSLIENASLYENLSLKDNMQIFCNLHNVEKEKLDKTMKLLNLDINNKKKVSVYSLGMKQRVGIAIALLAGKKIVVLDEPTNGLDFYGIVELRNILLSLKDVTIVVSSHNLSELEKLCDEVMIVSDGKVVDVLKMSKNNDCLESVLLERVK